MHAMDGGARMRRSAVTVSLCALGWAIARYDSRDGYGAHPREAEYIAADAAAPDLGCYPDDEP